MIFLIVIERSIETVFEQIRDLSGYKAWLPASRMFTEVMDISDYPVRVGTTYADKGPAAVMRGEVAEMEPPKLIAFRQVTDFKRGVLSGELTMSIRYSLEAVGSRETLVTRELGIQTTGLLTVMQPVLAMAIRKEDERVLQRLKEYLEARVGA